MNKWMGNILKFLLHNGKNFIFFCYITGKSWPLPPNFCNNLSQISLTPFLPLLIEWSQTYLSNCHTSHNFETCMSMKQTKRTALAWQKMTKPNYALVSYSFTYLPFNNKSMFLTWQKWLVKEFPAHTNLQNGNTCIEVQ